MTGENMKNQAVLSNRPLLAGKWESGIRGKRIVSPWTGAACAEYEEASAEQAARAAEIAAEIQPTLRSLTTDRRADALRRIADGIEREKELFARLICEDVGKPLGLARAETMRAVGVFRLAAEEAARLTGESVDAACRSADAGCSGRVFFAPAGPVLAIGPFNFPLNLLAHKIAPALAAGCAVVVKPPPQGPRAVFLLGKLILESGIPEAAVQVLPTDLEAAGVLTASPLFAALSFTGSAKVGWALKRNAPVRQRVLLELGGNAALIVDESADLSAAAKAAAVGAYTFAGQICISTQRIYVQRNVAERFLEQLVRIIAAEVPVGDDPHDEKILCGPLIDAAAAARIESWMHAAEKRGATALIPWERRSPRLLTPSLWRNVPTDEPLYCEEVFGPTAAVELVPDFATALQKADDSQYGLQTAVFTRDFKHVEQAQRELECGAVLINLPTLTRVDALPYGGVKDSGWGREGVREALRAYSEQKLVLVKESL
jgi:glyceraldehyde-3-phosphate dehydrogenase (NADP+)